MNHNIVKKALSSNTLYTFIILITPLIILFAQRMIPMYYNNDDFFLCSIASGEFTGTPETHLLHIGYLTSLLISTLYRLIPSLPWYGLVIFLYAYISITVSFIILLKYTKHIWHRLLLTLLSLLLIYSFLFTYLLQIQYTTVTAMVCTAAIVQFYHTDYCDGILNYLREQFPSFLLLFLSIELRDKACIMFLPMLFLLIAARFITSSCVKKHLLTYTCCLIILITFAFLVDKMAYSSADWKSFVQYNSSREAIVDYGGYPSYEEYQAIYESLGISQASYESAKNNYLLLLDENINTEFMQTLEKLSPEHRSTLYEIVSVFWGMHIDLQFGWPINAIVFFLYGAVALMIFVSKKWIASLDLLSVFSGRMIIWIYVLYIQRPIPRITEGIYIAELLLLLSIFFRHQLWSIKSRRPNYFSSVLSAFLLVCLVLISFKWGVPFAKRIDDRNITLRNTNSAYQEVFSYMQSNSENFYLLDVYSFLNLSEPIFSRPTQEANNYTFLGGWTANSPWTDRISERENFSSFETAPLENKTVYFVFLESSNTSYDYLLRYYQTKYPDVQFAIADTFTSTNGSKFLFLQCQQE